MATLLARGLPTARETAGTAVTRLTLTMKTSLRLIIAALGLAAFNLCAATLYVSLDSPNPAAPYTNWASAAHVIQDAVDVAKVNDTVLVTNGVYAVGERNGNRVVITNAITLLSLNGPAVTAILGARLSGEVPEVTNAVRCVLLGANAVLSGFTLTNGSTALGLLTYEAGGGVLCEQRSVVTNCILTGNWADYGGGAHGGTLYNCTLTANAAVHEGGGACDSILDSCTLTSNSAGSGGGAANCTLYHCTLTDNNSQLSQYGPGGGAYGCTLYNCTLNGNRANLSGGGASECTLYGCTLTRNFGPSDGTFFNCTAADNQGGIFGTAFNCIITGNTGGSDATFFNCTVTGNEGSIWGMAYNSIIYYNSGGNYAGGTLMNYCCTTPLPTNGIGNITGPPLFMDMAAGDFRLWEGSPCIDAATNLLGYYAAVTNVWGNVVFIAYTYEPVDILGNTRFIDGNGDGKVAWDIGAYEFNSFKPPRFAVAPQFTTDGWILHISGEPNKWLRVQRSNDIKNWEDIWSGRMGAEGVCQVSDYTESKMMFYRAVVP